MLDRLKAEGKHFGGYLVGEIVAGAAILAVIDALWMAGESVHLGVEKPYFGFYPDGYKDALNNEWFFGQSLFQKDGNALYDYAAVATAAMLHTAYKHRGGGHGH
jgi:hypothetical protein